LGFIADNHQDCQRLYSLRLVCFEMVIAAILGVVLYGALWLFSSAVLLMH
jgi:hypothetical protein